MLMRINASSPSLSINASFLAPPVVSGFFFSLFCPFSSRWISLSVLPPSAAGGFLSSALLCQRNVEKAMDMISIIADPVIQLMKDVIQEEKNCETLQTNLRRMDTTVHHDEVPEAALETLKIWLQVLHNCLTKAESILHRSDPRQRQWCHDCLISNPGRLSNKSKNGRYFLITSFKVSRPWRPFNICNCSADCK